MADLSTNLAGIKSPNPFWVASGPPANTGYQAHRAFEARLAEAIGPPSLPAIREGLMRILDLARNSS